MKLYHVAVEQEDDWYIGRVLDRGGVTTQGKSLDELVIMLRDAIELMWEDDDIHLELILAPNIKVRQRRRTSTRKASA